LIFTRERPPIADKFVTVIYKCACITLETHEDILLIKLVILTVNGADTSEDIVCQRYGPSPSYNLSQHSSLTEYSL